MHTLRHVPIAAIYALLWLLVPGGALGPVDAAAPPESTTGWLWPALRDGAALRTPTLDRRPERWSTPDSAPDAPAEPSGWWAPLPGHHPWTLPEDDLDEWDALDGTSGGVPAGVDDSEDRP